MENKIIIGLVSTALFYYMLKKGKPDDKKPDDTEEFKKYLKWCHENKKYVNEEEYRKCAKGFMDAAHEREKEKHKADKVNEDDYVKWAEIVPLTGSTYPVIDRDYKWVENTPGYEKGDKRDTTAVFTL
jgi:hypothetical protein